MLVIFSSYIVGRETLEDHSQIPKKVYKLMQLQAFRMYGGLSMSVPFLHIQSIDRQTQGM